MKDEAFNPHEFLEVLDDGRVRCRSPNRGDILQAITINPAMPENEAEIFARNVKRMVATKAITTKFGMVILTAVGKQDQEEE